MPPEALRCDAELLRRSLDDRLSEADEQALARHLAECPRCQSELERLAASQDDWSRVGAALRESSVTRLAPASDHSDDLRDDLAVDFAVDFLEPATQPQTLGRLGDIDILEVIGQGGMGIVLKGFQAELNRPVAVKVLAPHLATSAAARKRFAREAQAAAAILHPNVMPILTVNSSGRLPFLVMPFVTGESLQQRLDRTGPFPVLDILRIALQTANGLAAAHAQGLVHRDIKPANILLERGVDRVMLTDFGLARAVDDASLTRSGIIAGTPQYMSPEQARGEAIDARSDLFSLGSVLYTLCTGRPPFRAETSYGILRRVTDDAPRPIRDINAEIPVWLAAFVNRLLEKEPSRRFASAAEVAEMLEQCVAHVQQPTRTPLPPSVAALAVPATRRPPARRVMIAAAALVLIAGVVTGVSLLGHRDQTNSSTQTAGNQPDHGEPPTNPAVSTDWDATAADIQQLNGDIGELERRAERLWDREPTLP